MSQTFDMAVIGGGLTGLTAALACASKGAKVVLFDRDDPAVNLTDGYDGRASAIAASSFRMFEHLGIANALGANVQPINDILITDGETGRPPSPLSVHFDSHDLGGDPMGYMVENRRLRRALYRAIEASNSIELRAPAVIETLEFGSSDVQIMIEDSDAISAQLVVAADGRNSFCRKLAGIDTTQITYSQKAIVTTVHHEKPHHGVAHELFLPAGPFAILPLTDNRSSIVWTDSPKAVDAAMALPEKMFEAELGRRFGDFLGMVAPCAPRWAYPLSLQLAERYTGSRLALLGDAAHVIHPIAGQGLNMGLRDAAALADVVGAALSRGLDPGGAAITEYGQWRNFDNHMLAGATDVLNRLFSNNVAPVKHVRRLGLGVVNRISPLRTFFMSEASGQTGELPSLLRIR